MDPNAASEQSAKPPQKPERVALNVLALCFALSVLGRGLGESFTVFLKPISEDFGWDRAQIVSAYSLAALVARWGEPVENSRHGNSSNGKISNSAVPPKT